MRWMQGTAIMASVLAAATAGAQTTYYVDGTCGNDTWSGTDPVCAAPDGPKLHIQPALDVADPNDIVIVYGTLPPVTYQGAGNVNLDFYGEAIELRSSTGNPNTCIINGGGANRAILFDDGETRGAKVIGFSMVNCQGAAVRCEYSDPTINNCWFTDNTAASGGAVYLVGSAPYFTGCDFYENSATLDGGAVYAAGSDAEFLNCYFYRGTQGNSADFGGALYAVSCPAMSLTNCHFNYNTASTDGGAVYIDNHCNPSLGNCSFELNSAVGDGGACFIDYSSDPTFSTCTFTENTVGDDGGAIYNRDGSHIIFSNCDFTSNVAPSGGGAIKNEAASCEITGGEFEDNEAIANRGGALRNIDGSSAVITDAVFTDNRAGEGGGAVHSVDSTLEMDGCSFWINVAGTNGGAIRSTGATSTADITSCDFTGNRADLDGGAIANANDSVVTVTGGNFTQNVAVGWGGGLVSESATANISGAQLEGNAAAENGGGIANLSGSVTVSSCDFIGNTAGEAGAGLLTDGGDATVTGSTFTDNIAFFAGGGLFSHDSPTVTVEDSTFTHNWATGSTSYGGAMYIELGTLSLARCGFYEWNEAVTAGGALYTRGAAVSAEDCDFGRDLVGNTAGSGGGAYHEAAGPDSAEYKWCRFISNIASTGGGGGVALVDHNAMLHNCAFVGNESFATGGAIDAFAMINTSLELANCLFWENITDVAGGAVRVSNNGAITTGTIANCSFSRNEATNPLGEGGGVWVGGTGPSNVGIDNSIFWENQDGAGNVFSAQIFRDPPSPCVVRFDNSCFTSPACPPAMYLRPKGTNICANPVFANPAGGNFHLLTSSPCVDAADNTAVPPDTLDLDDDPNTAAHTPLDLDAKERFMDDPTVATTGVGCPHYPDPYIVDMGCYERCSGDVDGDGDTDHGDLGALLAAWCSVAGDPSWNPNADLDGDGHVGHGDLGVLLADWGCGT